MGVSQLVWGSSLTGLSLESPSTSGPRPALDAHEILPEFIATCVLYTAWITRQPLGGL